MAKLGVMGVGDLADKIVRGLLRQNELAAENVLLSPRSSRKAEALAKDLGCTVLSSNQEVVDGADVLLISVRPDQLGDLSSQIRLSGRRTIISVVAGISVNDLRQLFGHHDFVRSMLSYASEIGQSTVTVFPRHALAEELLSKLGNLVACDVEGEFELATIGACMNGCLYFLADELQRWLIKAGLPPETARALVLNSMTDCAAYSRFRSPTSIADIGRSIATPGTFTALGVKALRENGGLAGWPSACEEVFRELGRSTTQSDTRSTSGGFSIQASQS
ncbi:pyrroline-5-carboxylate reductase family protein [Paraburkholderia sp. UCT2]|uniref:pyrroline-5-carboxylate reductase family protein n=1 Tax=Paraburkholderia sp. UCT2 TaxID=2615208 RepID=UPI001655F511|nr:NAD(P)-binding domain-containing protein [Paraburkholderia sp. UCT2]MBC8727756.1 pyrroline-5-carboxylate reductase [Paraburkholderia sp. UCT2]